MAANPHHIQPLSTQTKVEVDELVSGVEVDLDSPLDDEEA